MPQSNALEPLPEDTHTMVSCLMARQLGDAGIQAHFPADPATILKPSLIYYAKRPTLSAKQTVKLLGRLIVESVEELAKAIKRGNHPERGTQDPYHF